MNILDISESIKNNPVVVAKTISSVAAVAAVIGIAHPDAQQIEAISGAVIAVNALLAVVVRGKVVPMRKLPSVPVDESVHPAVPE